MALEPCSPHDDPVGEERSALDLDAAELLVVGAVRAWVAPLAVPPRPAPDWRLLIRLAGVAAEAALGLESLLTTIAGNAVRTVDVRCPGCPSVSPDEEAMLGLVAALQEGEALVALGWLGGWLPDAEIGPALRGAQRFATLLAAAGLRLSEGDGPGAARGRARPTLH